MPDLTMKEKLDIANSGGQFQESGYGSWVGIKIRKGDKLGVVICDMNGAYRSLTVLFENGTEELIEMNNIGSDLEYIHQYEWLYKYPDKEVWCRF